MAEVKALQTVNFERKSSSAAEFAKQFSVTTKNSARVTKLFETLSSLMALVTGRDGFNHLAGGLKTYRGFANPFYRLPEAANRLTNASGEFECEISAGEPPSRAQVIAREGTEVLSVIAPAGLLIVTSLGFVKFLHSQGVINLGDHAKSLSSTLTWVGTPSEVIASLNEFVLAHYMDKQIKQMDRTIESKEEALKKTEGPEQRKALKIEIKALRLACQEKYNKCCEKVIGGTKYFLSALSKAVNLPGVPVQVQLVYALVPRGLGVYQSWFALAGERDVKQKKALLEDEKAKAAAV